MAANSSPEPGNKLPNFDAWWDYNDPAASEKKFRELLPTAKDSGDRAYEAELLTQIARTQGLQREFDAAHQTLDQVMISIAASTHKDMTRPRIRYLLERGRVLNSSKEIERARRLFLEAWNVARECDEDFYAVDAAHMLGIVDTGDDSLTWNEKAMAVAEASSDPRANGWLGSLYNNIGWAYHDMGRYDDALATFEKCLAWQREHDKPREAQIARWSIARTLRSLGRVDEALAAQQELEREHAAAGTKDGYVQEELGECLLLLNRIEDARPHFARAHELLSQDAWLVANESNRLARLRRIAEDGEP